ncbi:superoxide dismutase family protein [Haloimpatiens massiliensis]|uniref:superoxide dismutase family protein n=1 Tax=Haloimpatiens massiliensis TaxID=1658110 RepID=UPI000C8410C7|nr:superoxide dismutase family protein [Haloimpatiens massiliensis]
MYSYYCPYFNEENYNYDFCNYNFLENYFRKDSNPPLKNTAYAQLTPSPLAPDIRGVVYFMDVPGGTQVCIKVTGLPEYKPASGNNPPIGPHGFHIYQFGNCAIGDANSPFKGAGEHWNPTNQPHGNHAGDFPVLFSNNGYAAMCFFTNKFKVKDVIGKSVIIHESPDDYRSQPSGNAGRRLACGVII